MLGFQGLAVTRYLHPTIIDIPTMYLRRIFGTARVINLLIVVKFFTILESRLQENSLPREVICFI